MTAGTPSLLVPKRRFPDFRNAGEWTRDHIGSIATISKGRGISKADVAEGGETPCIRYAELYTNYGEVIREVLYRTNLPPEDLILSEVEDVLVPASGESRADIARAACVIPPGVALGSDINILRSELSGRFFSYLLNSPLRHTIALLAQGDTVAHLYPGQLSTAMIAYPLPAEQLKIADCLASLDELIAAEGQKLEALRQHKQGLMQRLFPEPGETRPRLRFPEFRASPVWRPSLAGSLFSQRVEKGEAGLPIYSVTIDSGMVERSTLGRNFYDIKAAFGNRLVREDDIAYNTMRMWQGACGRAPVDCMVSPAYVVLAPKAIAHSLFFQYLFKTTPMLQVLTAHSRGLTKDRLRLYYDDFAAIPLVVPDVPEQVLIAECLSSCDRVISAHAMRLVVLSSHKQGLLQQLFPSLEVETK